jgi:hypothetical protein
LVWRFGNCRERNSSNSGFNVAIELAKIVNQTYFEKLNGIYSKKSS